MKLRCYLSLLGAGVALATPEASNITSSTSSATAISAASASVNPCAALSESAKTYASQHPQATSLPFKPSEVYACQQDVPFNETLATALLDWLNNFLQFQSTLAYLKKPPPAYQLPAVDLIDGLKDLSNKVSIGNYKNEYDFEYDVYNLINSAADGHLHYYPYLIFLFGLDRGAPLVSVSSDGVQLPKVYLLDDIQEVFGNTKTNYTPSALKSINGQDIEQHLDGIAVEARQFQDLDAQYNALFYNPSTEQFTEYTKGKYNTDLGSLYHSDSAIYTFENGTNITLPITSTANMDIRFGSGQELFTKYLIPPKANSSSASASPTALGTPTSSSATSVAASSSASSPTVSSMPGYPHAEVITDGGIVSGYFLSSNNSDVAVLSVPTFLDPAVLPQPMDFQQAVKTFLADCRSAGKSKLIIDVRGNPGGEPYVAFDLFKQLFPNDTPYSGLRIRDIPAANALGQEVSRITLDDAINGDSNTAAAYKSVYNYQTSLQKPDGANFTSWQQLYGPNQVYGDSFSAIHSWSFFSATLDILLDGIVVSGYANNTNVAPAAFASENITLLTDGQCSSTCALFSNLLVRQGKVKTVTAGGRPNNRPMAAIGGTQGGQAVAFDFIASIATAALEVAKNSSNSSELPAVSPLLDPLILPPPILPKGGLSAQGLNLRDNIAQNDSTQTPLQFTYTPADCRIFYTPADILDVSNTWVRVAEGGPGLCLNTTIPPTNTTSTRTATPTASATRFLSGASSLRLGWGAAVLAPMIFLAAM